MTSFDLGVDYGLVDPQTAQERIIVACVKQWFATGPNGLPNYGDCSGFVKSVQRELLLQPFAGDANAIFDEVDQRSDWSVVGTGPMALPAAGGAANAGFFTIGVWRNAGKNGHVAIITAYLGNYIFDLGRET